MTWQPELEELDRRKAMAYEMGGPERIADQRRRGKLTVRERIDGLVDPCSFEERGVLAGSASYDEAGQLVEFRSRRNVFGLAKVGGRDVVISADDYTARPASGGAGVSTSGGRGGGARTQGPDAMALNFKVPLVRLIDGFGGDIRAVAGMGRTYIPAAGWESTHAMLNEIPLVAMALGAVAGLPAALVAGSHFSVMVKGISQVFAAGPPVVRRALGTDITKEELGGWEVHTRSGVVDNVAETEAEAFEHVRQFLSYLPSSVHELPPIIPCDDPVDRREEALLSIIPRSRNRAYNPREMIRLIVDKGSAFEMGRNYGGAQITMFARIGGMPFGLFANDPLVYGGAMDSAAAQKAEKFVDLCDLFHLPIINFADQPGFLVGLAAESAGTLKQGTRLLSAMEDATIPWSTVVVRRLYGVAGQAHQSHTRFSYRIAWPSGEWGSLPIEGGVSAAYRREIEAAEDPVKYQEELEARLRAMRSPFRTAEAFDVEDIIDPRDTRPLLHQWLQRAYRNLPLTLTTPKRRGMRP